MKFDGKNVLITGASGEIGRAVALEFAKAGANLVLHYRSNSDAAAEVEDAAMAAGARAAATFAAELSSFEQASRLAEFALGQFGRVHALICLSGGVTGNGSIVDTNEADWKKALDANVMSVVNSVRATIPHLSTEASRIVITASVRGMPTMGRESAIGYSTAKGALITLSSTIAKQLGPTTLVNAISPGFVWTRNYKSLDPDLYNSFIEQTLLKRFLTPAEIAPAYLFACETDVMTGQNLVLDGGYSLKF